MLVIKWRCSIRDFRLKFHLRYIACVAGVEREKDREKGKKGGPIEWLGARRDGWSRGKGRREEGESGEREGERERERAIRTGTFVTKKGHFCNGIGNFCNQGRELL